MMSVAQDKRCCDTEPSRRAGGIICARAPRSRQRSGYTCPGINPLVLADDLHAHLSQYFPRRPSPSRRIPVAVEADRPSEALQQQIALVDRQRLAVEIGPAE